MFKRKFKFHQLNDNIIVLQNGRQIIAYQVTPDGVKGLGVLEV